MFSLQASPGSVKFVDPGGLRLPCEAQKMNRNSQPPARQAQTPRGRPPMSVGGKSGQRRETQRGGTNKSKRAESSSGLGPAHPGLQTLRVLVK